MIVHKPRASNTGLRERPSILLPNAKICQRTVVGLHCDAHVIWSDYKRHKDAFQFPAKTDVARKRRSPPGGCRDRIAAPNFDTLGW
ncbi:hypothetical protein CERZMDRAFT_90760 [Cercospora zeae-maydis SCOH1-5]|uniref:Uncharacterized protein n=1 Tax=Cercospora zeae-maydis SCOH1-5 TaxID=717836 RepID=A0A6A6FGT4_9PEZI|nr:hypothetical protein CERZMDRAFT_90760 [Cercospora zeae-maydis SCOH1-5]